MKKIAFIVLALLISFSVFAKAEPMALPTFECIFYYSMVFHMEPLSRTIPDPLMYNLYVGYRSSWNTAATGHLVIRTGINVRQDGVLIDELPFAEKNLYPNSTVEEVVCIGEFPGGKTYTALGRGKFYHPGCITPSFEIPDTKSICPPRN